MTIRKDVLLEGTNNSFFNEKEDKKGTALSCTF